VEDRIQRRLDELEKEFALGQTKLQELTAQETQLRETLCQIVGAVRVLRELTAEGASTSTNGQAAVPSQDPKQKVSMS
jgi:hypothetical protein